MVEISVKDGIAKSRAIVRVEDLTDEIGDVGVDILVCMENIEVVDLSLAGEFTNVDGFIGVCVDVLVGMLIDTLFGILADEMSGVLP